MIHNEREALARRVGNFYYDSSNNSVKTTVNYFVKQHIPRNTIYFILKKHLKYEIKKDRSRSGRPVKSSNKNFKDLFRSINNRCGLSQCKIARRFRAHQSTISRNLRRRTSVRIMKCPRALKMDSADQEKRI